MKVKVPFETALQVRGLEFTVDDEGQYHIDMDGTEVTVNLGNLERDFVRDGKLDRVRTFVDAIVATLADSMKDWSTDRLYWSLEPNDYDTPADYRQPVSDVVDRVLVHVSSDHERIIWVTPQILEQLGISEQQASDLAFANLSRALSESKLEIENVAGVPLAFISTALPFKTSLLLTPNLKEFVQGQLEWPLLAVAPDRNFLYLWPASQTDFVQRVGGVVVQEYSQASYPISTEVYEVSDQGLRAIGAFPTEE